MKINFVTEPKEKRWILRKWCEEWQKRIPDSFIDVKPRNDVDVNVYVNYAMARNVYKEIKTIQIGVFTHKEKEGKLRNLFEEIAEKMDWCFAQCQRTLKFLPQEKSSIIKIGVDEKFLKEKIKIGIVGREYPSGRKRFEWVEEIKKIPNVEIFWSTGQIKDDDMPKFYDSIDYVLVTSENEGGPMCVKEALARGKMVISTRCGWADEYPIILYDTVEELRNIISKLIIKDEWDESAKQIIDKSKELLGEK